MFPGFSELQRDLSRVVKGLEHNGFQISPEKTQIILFRRNFHNQKFQTKDFPKFQINGKFIEYSNQVKFLGVTFQNTGSLKNYTDHIRNQARKGINLLRCVQGFDWGTNPRSLLQIYHAHVMSRLLYAAPILTHLNTTQLTRLSRVQTLALKAVLGVPRRTNNEAIIAETGQIPLELIIKQRAAAFYFKTIAQPDTHPANSVLTHHYRNRTGKSVPPPAIEQTTKEILQTGNISFDTEQKERDPEHAYPPWEFIDPHIDLSLTQFDKTNQPHHIRAKFMETSTTTYADFTPIFTDGSHIPSTGQTGAGIYFPGYKHRADELTNHTSIFSAEITAIYTATCLIEEFQAIHPNLSTGKFLIVTDSLSSIQAIQNKHAERTDLVLKVLNQLTKMKHQNLTVTIMWVPSHIGILGNEKADTLARSAISNDPDPPNGPNTGKYEKTSTNIGTSPNERQAVVKQLVRKIWDKQYKDKVKGIRKKLHNDPSKKLITYKGPRAEQSRISRMRVGMERYHCLKTAVPCECGEPISTQHLLLECTINNTNARPTVVSELRTLGLQPTLANLLAPPPEAWHRILTLTLQILYEHPQGNQI